MRNPYDQFFEDYYLNSYEWFMNEFERLMKEHHEKWELSLSRPNDSHNNTPKSQREWHLGTFFSNAFVSSIVYGISTGFGIYIAHRFRKSKQFETLRNQVRSWLIQLRLAAENQYELIDWKGIWERIKPYQALIFATPSLIRTKKFQYSYIVALGTGTFFLARMKESPNTVWTNHLGTVLHQIKYAMALTFTKPWQLLLGALISNVVPDESDSSKQESKQASDHSQSKQQRDFLPLSPPRVVNPTHPPPFLETKSTSVISTQASSTNPSRYLEVLLHNVSHSDMVFNLQSSVTNEESLARPRFSCFEKYSRLLKEHLQNKNETATLVGYPRYERSLDSPRYSIKNEPSKQTCPIGFRLMHGGPLVEEFNELRIRGKDQDKGMEHATISHVFFPLLANLLPRWERQIEDRQYNRKVKKVLILVTGVGTPRNWTHSVSGNSTQVCADLMEEFLKKVDPSIAVVKIHSNTNIFRYDENLLFVERELAPVINAYRDAQATGQPYPDETSKSNLYKSTSVYEFNTEWRKSMSVTLSFADGSSARTHAIQASLRSYRPAYFHFWQLKTFWHESKIVDDDIEVHSFEAMETTPAVDTDRLVDPNILLVVKEMNAFRDQMIKTLQGENDIRKFWLRKTHKPVLAVLLVQTKEMKEPVLYRGTNMEVSMPTGSLCAERNVIGSALAENPSLKREDLKLIAVLAVPSLDATADEGMKRVSSSVSIGSQSSNADDNYQRKISIGSEVDAEWILPPTSDLDVSMIEHEGDQGEKEEQAPGTATPVRRIQLFSRSAAARRPKRTVIVQSTKDINPLSPCGACNEWLKKIAESNPYFQILTFTDANCHGVYCTPCQE